MKKIISLLLVFMMIFTFASCGGSSSDEGAVEQEVIHWDFASQNSATHAMGLAHQELFKAIEERTDGRLVITYHPEGELPVNQSEFIVACGEGTVQMAAGDVSAVGGSLTSGLLPAMPFLIQDFDTAHEVVDGIWDSIEKDVNNYGCHALYYTIYPLQQIWGAGKVPSKLADIKGLDIRSQGTEMSKALELAGVNPITLAGAEVASSLSRGVIDGGVTAGITVTAAGWYPYVDWGYLLNLTCLPCYVVVNQEAWDALPDDIKTIVEETVAEYQAGFFDEYVQNAEEEQWNVLKDENDVTIIEMSKEDRDPLVEAMVPYWYEYAESMGDAVVADLEKILDILGIEH